MITPDGYFDWAVRAPMARPDKRYSGDFPAIEGALFHSMVGFYGNALARMNSNERTGTCVHGGVHLPEGGDYTAYAAASWVGSITYGGGLYQHAPLSVACWTNGSGEANRRFRGFEFEGGPPGRESEPFTTPQLLAGARILYDMREWRGWPELRRPQSGLTGQEWEHREMTRFGAPPTACPSNRPDWAAMNYIVALMDQASAAEEDKMVVGQFATSVPWDKSYVITVGKEGARKTLVQGAAEYESLVAAGFPVKVMTATQLRRIISSPGTPEP